MTGCAMITVTCTASMEGMILTETAAAEALAHVDLLALGQEADAFRRSLHPQNTVTYAFETAADLAQITQPNAAFAADRDGWTETAERALESGSTDLVVSNWALHGQGTLAGAESMLRAVSSLHPDLRIHGISAADVLLFAAESRTPAEKILRRLRDAGLQSISAAGAGLVNGAYSGNAGQRAITTAQWLDVHRASHEAGLPSEAAMVIGMGESAAERTAYLASLRQLQEETGGFVSFALSVHHPASAQARREEEATAVDYLKTLAIARLLLDNIAHVQAEWTAQGPKVLELALRFGADDAGTISVMRAPGGREPSHHAGEAELRRIIRDAGFRPVRRDRLYRQSFPY